MPFALLFIGILLIVVAVRDKQGPFLATLGSEFSGPGNFFYWVIALAVIGAIGYIPKAKPVSDAFLVLILLALVLTAGRSSARGGGVFQQLTAALSTTNQPSATSITAGGAAGTVGGIVKNLVGGSIS